MTSDRTEIQREAREILDALAFTPFEDCQCNIFHQIQFSES
ncbi:excinuclease ABC subunit C [Leptolyngbya sp. NIES-3755]|nr:excinuclease ABC subunit C [Leptolyngbya sp. NIES-3755]